MKRRTFLATSVAGALLARAAAAQTDPQDRADLARIAAYLNGITSIQARFTQIADNGAVAQGDFYLWRPGRMRIEYDPPVPYLYIADGFMLTFWDAELEQRSDVLLGTTLADFITREQIQLTGDITVSSLRRTAESVEIDLFQTDDPAAGTLTLVLRANPMQLSSWTVVDAQGVATQVLLNEARYGVPLDADLFVAATSQLPRLR